MLPFRDVSRAIEATLSHPRAHVARKGFDYPRKRGVYDQTLEVTELAGRAARFGEARGRGLGAYVNHDQIVLLPGPYENRDEIDGRYGPERNLNLDPGGRVLELVSAGAAWFSGRGSTDGFGSELDLLRPTQAAGADKNAKDAEQKGVLYAAVVAFTNGRTRWETFETFGAAPGNGSNDADANAAAGGSGRRRLASLPRRDGAEGWRRDGGADDAAEARRQTGNVAGSVAGKFESAARREARREKDAHAASADANAAFVDDAAARRRRYQGSRA